MHKLYTLSVLLIFVSCTLLAQSHKKPSDVAMDGYKGKVKKVTRTVYPMVNRNNVWEPDTLVDKWDMLDATYHAEGWILSLEAYTIPDDSVRIAETSQQSEGGNALVMRMISVNKTAVMNLSIKGAWLNDSTYKQTGWIGTDTSGTIYMEETKIFDHGVPIKKETVSIDGADTQITKYDFVYYKNETVTFVTGKSILETYITSEKVLSCDKFGNRLRTIIDIPGNYTYAKYQYEYY